MRRTVQEFLNAYKWAWVPIPCFTMAIGVLYWMDSNIIIEPHIVLTISNLVFCASVSFLVAYLAARSYLAEGDITLILLGSSMLVWGLTTTLFGFLVQNMNHMLTFHNAGVFVAGSCSLAAAFFAFLGKPRSGIPQETSELIITLSYLFFAVLTMLLALGASYDLFPPFYVAGQGATLLRQAVLGGAIAQFAASALIFWLLSTRSRLAFLRWYSLGLTLLTIGLLGVWLTVPGTPLNWLSRSAQFFAGIYILAAVFTIKRSPGGWRLSIEKALRESQEKYHLLFNNMTNAFAYHKIILDENGKPVDYTFLEVNDAFEKLTGLKRKTVLGRRVTEVFPNIRKEAADWIGRYGKVALSGEIMQFEDFSEPLNRWYSVSAYCPEKGYFVAIFEDITGRKQAEAALIRERSVLDSVMRTTDAMLVFLDLQFNFGWVNNAYAETCKMKPEEMIGKNHFVLYPNAENEAIFRNVRDTGEGVFFKDKPFSFPDQPERGVTYWDWSLTPVKDSAGKVTGLVFSLRETTKHKQAEFALQRSHEELEKLVLERTQELMHERVRLNEVLEMMPAYVVILDSDYRVPFANRFFIERFGESRGRRCYEYLFNRKEPCENCETFKVMKTHTPHHWEWSGPDGRNYDIFDFPFFDADGSPCIMEMGIDITEQKRAQDALLQSSQYVRSLIEASLDPLVTISVEGKITDVNEATIKATGLSRQELIGTDFSSYFAEPEKARAGYEQVFAQGYVTDYPLTIRHKDGGLIDVLYNATIYKDSRGNVLGIFAAARDVTEQKRIEAELKKYREHLEELVRDRTAALRRVTEEWERTFETVPDLIAILDSEHRVLRANRAMASRLGVTPAQCVGLPCYKAVHGTDAPPSFCPHSLTCSDGKEHTVEVIEERLGGVFLVTTTPLTDEQGSRIGSVHVARDITERKRAEAELLDTAHRFELLALTSEELLRSHDPQKVVEDLCRKVMAHLDCHAFFNFLMDKQTGRLHLNAYAGIPPEEAKKFEWLDYGVAVCGCVAQDGCRIVAEHISTTPDPRTELVKSFGIMAYACHPLMGPKGVIGTLSFGTRSRETFSDNDLSLMKAVTDMVAVAMIRIRNEQALRQSEMDLTRAQEVAKTGSWRMNTQHNELLWSDEAYRLFGIPKGTALTYETFLASVHPDDREYVDRKWQAALNGAQYDIEHRIVVNGEIKWVREKADLEFDPEGRLLGAFGTVQDITGRKLYEEQIEESLKEKEALLAEIHHRVKNNLQIILSMLNLQLPYIKDEQTVELFKDSKNRIYSMALIHESLYQSESLARVDFPKYVRRLVENLFRSYGMDTSSIRAVFHIEEVAFTIDTLIPCALIINELVSNALKHGFPASSRATDGQGEIRIVMHHDTGSKFVLSVSDNGIGIPNDFKIENCTSLGLKLVSILARQLNGSVAINANGKAEFIITFSEIKRTGSMP